MAREYCSNYQVYLVFPNPSVVRYTEFSPLIYALKTIAGSTRVTF